MRLKKAIGFSLAGIFLWGAFACSRYAPELEIERRHRYLRQLLAPLVGQGEKEVLSLLDREFGMAGTFYTPLQWARGKKGEPDRETAAAHLRELMGTGTGPGYGDYRPEDYRVLFYEKHYGKRDVRTRKVLGGKLIEEFEQVAVYDLVNVVFKDGKMAGWKAYVYR